MKRSRLRRKSHKKRASTNELIVDPQMRREFMARHQFCELFSWWSEKGYPESLPAILQSALTHGSWSPFATDPHHVTPQSRRIDENWNLVAVCRQAHEWVQWNPEGLLYCILVLRDRGDLKIDKMDQAFGGRSVLNYLEMKSGGWCDFSQRHLKSILSTPSTERRK